MVKIITGKIDSGKTTAIREYYNLNKSGDGIVSRKIMLDKQVFGYYALRLSDNLEFAFMIHELVYESHVQGNEDLHDTDFIYNIGPYKVYRKAEKKIDSIYKGIFKKKHLTIYFDEIGKLEINGAGFYKHLKKAVKKNRDIVFTAREDLVDLIVAEFNIEEYDIISR